VVEALARGEEKHVSLDDDSQGPVVRRNDQRSDPTLGQHPRPVGVGQQNGGTPCCGRVLVRGEQADRARAIRVASSRVATICSSSKG